MCPYFCKNLSVVMYRKYKNVPIFEDFRAICPYFLGFRVGKYENAVKLHKVIFSKIIKTAHLPGSVYAAEIKTQTTAVT